MTNRFTAPHHAQEFTENCGTLEYYAPELVKNLISTREGKSRHKYGASVDCWALGCIVYGRPPPRLTPPRAEAPAAALLPQLFFTRPLPGVCLLYTSPSPRDRG